MTDSHTHGPLPVDRDFIDPVTGHPRRWAILPVLCLSMFLVVVDNTIVNVALPTLSRELSATTSQLQWIVDAYSLVFASLLLMFGNLGDRFGRTGMLQADGDRWRLSPAGMRLANRAILGAAEAIDPS